MLFAPVRRARFSASVLALLSAPAIAETTPESSPDSGRAPDTIVVTGTLESRGYESWKKANAYLLNYHRLSYEATMRALQEDVQIETEAAADEARMVC